VMSKRKQPTTVSPKTKKTRHRPLPSTENNLQGSSAAASGRGTSPHGTVTADNSRENSEAEDPPEDDIGSLDEH
jgi:hypothetical protein